MYCKNSHYWENKWNTVSGCTLQICSVQTFCDLANAFIKNLIMLTIILISVALCFSPNVFGVANTQWYRDTETECVCSLLIVLFALQVSGGRGRLISDNGNTWAQCSLSTRKASSERFSLRFFVILRLHILTTHSSHILTSLSSFKIIFCVLLVICRDIFCTEHYKVHCRFWRVCSVHLNKQLPLA